MSRIRHTLIMGKRKRRTMEETLARLNALAKPRAKIDTKTTRVCGCEISEVSAESFEVRKAGVLIGAAPTIHEAQIIACKALCSEPAC